MIGYKKVRAWAPICNFSADTIYFRRYFSIQIILVSKKYFCSMVDKKYRIVRGSLPHSELPTKLKRFIHPGKWKKEIVVWDKFFSAILLWDIIAQSAMWQVRKWRMNCLCHTWKPQSVIPCQPAKQVGFVDNIALKNGRVPANAHT